MPSTLKVLIVDDEPVIAASLAAILRLSGYSVQSFTNPIEALASALVETPNLLISDVVMPEMSGIDLAVQITALCPDCKVLLFSGQAATFNFLKDANRVDTGFHILPKPIHPSDLLKAIRGQTLEH